MVRSVYLRGSCRGSRASLAKLAFIFASAGFLAGCVESAASLPPQADAPQAPLRRDGVSPRGASVALASLSGVPEPVADRMKNAFAQEATQRDITLADAKNADYLVRGYLNAAPTEAGTSITVVFDIFDAAKKRALRLEDALFVKGASAASDPWSAVDMAAIGDVAAKSADNLAAFLTNTPEANGAAKTRNAMAASKAATVSARSEDGRTTLQRTQPKLSSSTATASDLNLAALR
ncbi:hypothetical protein RZS28_15665 [Methylocapsa polymorpha]|uniref:Lipoprotein n=1 Tax=Methylocapsa polymorpha TaxID=3080828 RepID=A0ABZ0HRD6_9HYPH|nr:hypothetical protein RZS28_15665 [Methylocapsa sp. RX1]